MLLGLSRRIVSWLICKKTVVEADRELYEYAAYNLMFTSASLGVFLIISGIMGCLANGILILISLLVVRRYSGGFHAKTPLRCVCISLSLLTICLAFSVLVHNQLMIGIATFFSTIVVFIFSPVDSENRRLDAGEKRRCRLLARRNVIVLYILYILCTLAQYSKAALCIAVGIMAGAFLQIVCVPRLRREKSNQKS